MYQVGYRRTQRKILLAFGIHDCFLTTKVSTVATYQGTFVRLAVVQFVTQESGGGSPLHTTLLVRPAQGMNLYFCIAQELYDIYIQNAILEVRYYSLHIKGTAYKS